MIFSNNYDLIYALINELGLFIGQDNILYDQDTHCPIMMEGKYVKCSINPNASVYPSEHVVVFDPITNFKMMTMFMSFYFEKLKSYEDFYIVTYNLEEEKKRGPFYIKITGNDGDGILTSIVSGKYNNKCLVIDDIILRLSGVEPNLQNFDLVALGA